MTLLDTLITHADVMTPNGLERELAVGLANGQIVALGDAALALPAQHTVNAKGLTVLPGCIDSQVHFREPGLEYKEDLSTGTAGAVLGGITTVFEMPNTKPNTTTAEAIADKFARAQGRVWSNVAFFVGADLTNASQLAHLETLHGCSGVKIFMGSSTGNLLVADDDNLRLALRSGRRRVAIHAEDEALLLANRPMVEAEGVTVHTHPRWRSEEVCLRATQRILALAHETKRPIHVLHVTTAQEAELLAQHKAIATMEVTPQHLTLFAPDCYDRLGSYAQMNPPIREKHHQEALWRAVQLGVVDVLGSDHAPHTHEEKAKPYPQSPSGLTGVQTLLPLMLNHVHQGRLTLHRLVDLLCYGPARLFGTVGKGRIALGYDADLTLVDLNRTETITHNWMASKTGWTPFDGMQVTGWPVHTVVGGHFAVRDGHLQGAPMGQPVSFLP